MNGWQVQAMWEADAAAEWERLNAPDPCEKQMKSAAVDITEASHFVDIAEDRLGEATAELYGTPMEAVVESWLDQLENIRFELKSLAEKYGRGERE